MAVFKTSLVDHVFRGVWEANQSGGDSAQDTGDDDSDEEMEYDLGSSDVRTPANRHAASSSTDALAGAARVTKINQDALKLSSELLRLFVVEAFHRAQMEAMVDDSPTIEPHHVEQILAQLLLDF
uniref:Centromere protein X n=1 Tax=Globisporangium ultimum (strain ATCC 200006 / CBS 805.95 / DAOM BR144) TaxID=431595 RepID=K3X8K5_GLOUD